MGTYLSVCVFVVSVFVVVGGGGDVVLCVCVLPCQ